MSVESLHHSYNKDSASEKTKHYAMLKKPHHFQFVLKVPLPTLEGQTITDIPNIHIFK